MDLVSLIRSCALLCLLALLAACGGGSESSTTFTITASPSPAQGGTVTGAGNYEQGATATLSATPASGYIFLHWQEGDDIVSEEAAYSFTVSAARTLVARFERAILGDGAGFSLSPKAAKVFHFRWQDAASMDSYRILENPDGGSGFSPIAEDIPAGTREYRHIVPLFQRLDARYVLEGCNAGACTPLGQLSVAGSLALLLEAVGQVIAANADHGDAFGTAVALSADGNTLAVGAPYEDSAGDDGDPVDNGLFNSGAVYVFVRDGGTWTQQALLKPRTRGAGDRFGTAVSLSADGNTLAVGAPGEDSQAIGVNKGEGNNASQDSGAAYVFVRNGMAWSQQAYLKAGNTGRKDGFGSALSLSADGNSLAIGAPGESAKVELTEKDPPEEDVFVTFPGDNSQPDSGATYVFGRFGGAVWGQVAYLKSRNAETGDRFGAALHLSADGSTLAIGAPGEDGNGTDPANNAEQDSGAVYLFTLNDTAWTQAAYLKTANPTEEHAFGTAVGLDANGNTLAVGAPGEDSGAVYVFTRNGGTWNPQARVLPGNPGNGDGFGTVLSLSGEGNTLAVGAPGEDGSAAGLGGDGNDDGETDSGAAYVFTRDGGDAWTNIAYVKSVIPSAGDRFASALQLDGTGATLAVGAPDEGTELAPQRGSVFLY